MIRLFDKDATTFTTLGLGVVSDAEECTVDEEINGPYELSMTYPANGDKLNKLKNGNIIFCKPNPYTAEQAFRITEVQKSIDRMIDIRAQHISYQLSYIPTMPFKATTAASAFTSMKNGAFETCPFTFWTNVSKAGELEFDEPKSIRSLLGDGDDSVAGVFGGEFEFDNYSVKLHQNRGQNRGATFRYGRDLVDMSQEESISEVVTGIVPYWKGNVRKSTNPNAVTISTRAGYWSKTAHTFVADTGCKGTELNVTPGDNYIISTVIRQAAVAGVIFYGSNNAVVKTELVGSGETEEVTDYEITVPSGATKMAVNNTVAMDPLIVKNTELTVSLTIRNGYYSNSSYSFISNSAYRCAEVAVERGQQYTLNTKLNSTSIAGVVYYNKSNNVIGYNLLGEGEAQDISDYKITVPANAVKMAVNSSTTTAPTLKSVSNTDSESEDVMIMLTERVIHSANASSFPFQRTAGLNLTSEFDFQPSETELRAAANKYLTDNADLGVPKVTLDISIADLRKTDEYENMGSIAQVMLGDTVKVIFEDLGVSNTGEVLKTSYDVLRDEYTSITLGDPKPGLSEMIVATNKAAKEAAKAAQGTIQAWIAKLRAENENALQGTIDWVKASMEIQGELIRGGLGGHVIVRTNPGGWPEEILIMDTESISTCQNCIRLNKNGIGYSTNGYNGPFNSTWTIDGTFNAQTINVINLNGASMTIGVLRDRTGNLEWNLETGNLLAHRMNIVADNFYLKDDGEIVSFSGDHQTFARLNGSKLTVGHVSRSWDDQSYTNDEFNDNYIIAGGIDGTRTGGKANVTTEINSYWLHFDLDGMSVREQRNSGVYYQGESGTVNVGGMNLTFKDGLMVTALS